MSDEDCFRYGPLGDTCAHLCVDMQRMFAEKTEWHTPWMPRALPNVRGIVAAHPDRTWFTRFIPAERPGVGRGTWSRYSERWSAMTLEALDPGLVDLVPELAGFAGLVEGIVPEDETAVTGDGGSDATH